MDVSDDRHVPHRRIVGSVRWFWPRHHGVMSDIGLGGNQIRVVTATCPDRDTAVRLADELVAAELAACAQVGGPITSVYRWKGQVERDEEWILTIKTAATAVDRVVERLTAMHPYDVPEVLVGVVEGGHRPYLDWVRREVDRPAE